MTIAVAAAATKTAAATAMVTAVAMAAAAVAAAAAAAIVALLCPGKRSNPLTAAPLLADVVTGVAAASATAALQYLRLQIRAGLPAAAHTWRCWDRAAAAGAASPLLVLSPRSPLLSRI